MIGRKFSTGPFGFPILWMTVIMPSTIPLGYFSGTSDFIEDYCYFFC